MYEKYQEIEIVKKIDKIKIYKKKIFDENNNEIYIKIEKLTNFISLSKDKR